MAGGDYDSATTQRPHTHGSQPLLLHEQLALLLFGQPDVGNVFTGFEQLSVLCPSGQCERARSGASMTYLLHGRLQRRRERRRVLVE